VSSCSPRGLVAAITLSCLIVSGCAAGHRQMASAPMSASAVPAGMPTAPPPLDRSLFARDPNGQLNEETLQKILAAPIELTLPTRVGVLPIITATDWRGPGPAFEQVPSGLGALVGRLRKDASFSLVSEMMPIPSGALGMEALREAAARYRLRYLILYREVMMRDASWNTWAWGYATVLGALFMPGERLRVRGYLEATMFDVKTGTLMFTTRRAVFASETANEWHTDDKLASLEGKATQTFAPDLAVDALADLRRFAAAALAERSGGGGGDSTAAVTRGDAAATVAR
jgi:hypothetical protein